MKRCSVLMVMLAFVVGAAGCRQYNWFRQPSGTAITPSVTYSKPAMPAGMYVSPDTAAPTAPPVLYGPGSNAVTSQ
jgi:hypothetical protein